MRKLKFLLPLALFVPMLMAPSGGYPVNPTFQSVTVNTSGANTAGFFANNSAPGGVQFQQCGTSNAAGLMCWQTRVGSTGAYAISTANDTGTNLNDALVLTKNSAGGFTGAIIQAPVTGNAALTVNGPPSSNTTMNIQANSTASASYGLTIDAGTNSTDAGLRILDATGSTVYFYVKGDGGVILANLPSQGLGSVNATGYFVSSVPLVVSFDANLVVSPTFVQCHHCQGTPTVVRNSIGNYTIQPQSAGAYHWSCTIRNNAAAPGTVAINSLTTGGLILLGWSTGGALADPGTVECVGVA